MQILENLRESPKIDVLSAVMDFVSARSFLSVGLITGGDFSITTPTHSGLKFNALVRGRAWVQVDGEPAQRLEAGDCFILTSGRGFTVSSDPRLPAVDASLAFASTEAGVARYGEAEDVRFVGGLMSLDALDGGALIAPLPLLIHLPASSDEAGRMRWLLDRFVEESLGGSAGATSAASSLLNLMFIEGIRVSLATDPPSLKGWATGLADRRISDVLQAIHGAPAFAWTLGDLAAVAGMSRSNFSLRFRSVVGQSPLSYLSDWRIRLAGRALRTSDQSVSSIAIELGYGSESAFSNAFKRVRGLSPLQYRQAERREARARCDPGAGPSAGSERK